MKTRSKFATGGIFGLLFVLWIILIKTVDVAAIGPEGTEVGFSTINKAVHEALGVNMTLYDVTDILGYIAILIAGLWAALGLVQLIRRRSLAKVDGEIYTLAGLYVVTVGLYVFFEKVIINYRPIIMPDNNQPEASFPSSHTMLACVIFGSTIIMLNKYIKNEALKKLLTVLCLILLLALVVGRLASGVHWFTDIVGGLFVSAGLVFVFDGIIDKVAN